MLGVMSARIPVSLRGEGAAPTTLYLQINQTNEQSGIRNTCLALCGPSKKTTNATISFFP